MIHLKRKIKPCIAFSKKPLLGDNSFAIIFMRFASSLLRILLLRSGESQEFKLIKDRLFCRFYVYYLIKLSEHEQKLLLFVFAISSPYSETLHLVIMIRYYLWMVSAFLQVYITNAN